MPTSSDPGYGDLLNQINTLGTEDRLKLLQDLIAKLGNEDRLKLLQELISTLGKKDKLKLLEDLSLQVEVSEASWWRLAPFLLPEALRRKLLRFPWSMDDRKNLGLLITVPICIQDPAFAPDNPELRTDEIDLGWEPDLLEGPTSARLAVEDYNYDENYTNTRLPVQWSEEKRGFVDQHKKPIAPLIHKPEFRKLNVWAVVQRVLDFYEDFNVLGRPVPWAFSGNRLTIQPHFSLKDQSLTCYDRENKVLRFAGLDDANTRIYNCLSHDIIAHETGHAILDGIRPYFYKGYTVQCEAFHEFVGDLTAFLSALRNNDIRHIFIHYFEENKCESNFLADIGEQFGRAVTDRDYLRTARNPYTMADVHQWEESGSDEAAHASSQVLYGLIFDIFLRLLHSYWKERKSLKLKDRSPEQAAAWATDRITRMALQPLDYLPPADATFCDYVEALLRRDELLEPGDPYQYRLMIRQLCAGRQIPAPREDQRPKKPDKLARPYIDGLLASRSSAYEYIHANREALCIPGKVDLLVEAYAAERVGRAFQRLPREIIVQYLWEEIVLLDDTSYDFGHLRGEEVPLLCGGTLVFDENTNFLHWVTKPGMQLLKEREAAERKGKLPQKLNQELRKGRYRLQELLSYAEHLAAKLAEKPETCELDEAKKLYLSSFSGLQGRLC